ncbi:MAG: DNA polymerase III subunit gamma/tau C-terminal domain-containing protein, partial [bacterium]
ILGVENVLAEPAALAFLARMADGSMRDGLSILDQAISYGSGEVREADAKDMLGAVALDRLPQLLELIHGGDGAGILHWVAETAELAPDFGNLLKDLIQLLHRIALVQAVPGYSDPGWGEPERIVELANQFSPEDVQLYYQIALLGQRDLPLASDPRSGLEMVLIRMLAFRPGAEPATGNTPAKTTSRPVSSPAKPSAAPVAQSPAPVASKPTGVPADPSSCDWHTIMPQLALGGMSAQLASHCSVRSWEGDILVLDLDPQGKALLGSVAQEKLQQALNQFCGKPVKLTIEIADGSQDTPAQRVVDNQAAREEAALQSMQSDPLVQALQENMDATLIKESVRPID